MPRISAENQPILSVLDTLPIFNVWKGFRNRKKYAVENFEVKEALHKKGKIKKNSKPLTVNYGL
jgi:high-affinity nickel permease